MNPTTTSASAQTFRRPALPYRGDLRLARLRQDGFRPDTPERLQDLADRFGPLDQAWAPHADSIARDRYDTKAETSLWHAQRADSLRRGLVRRMAKCGGRTLHTACGCGTRAAPVGCGLASVCDACKRRRYGKMRARFARAMQALHANENATRPTGRGARMEWCLYTLTAPHSGDVQADRARIDRAWQRLRAWLQYRFGRSFPFCLVWEYTPGQDDRGHIHAHVTQLLPWLDFHAMREEWLRAMGETVGNFRIEQVQAHRAAKYVTKYVTKGVHNLSPEHGAAWLAVTHNRRNTRTSRGFYDLAGVACSIDTRRRKVPCACCSQGFVRVHIELAPFVPKRKPPPGVLGLT